MRSIPVDLILHELAARLAELPDTQHRDLHRAISHGCIRPQSLAEDWTSGAGVAQQAAWLVRRLDGEDMATPRLREIAAETRAMEVAVARRLADCALSLLVTQDPEDVTTAQALLQAAQRVVGLAPAKPHAEAARFTSAPDSAENGLSPARLRHYLAETRDALGAKQESIIANLTRERDAWSAWATKLAGQGHEHSSSKALREALSARLMPPNVDIVVCMRDNAPTTYKASNADVEYDTPEAAVRAAWEHHQRPAMSVPARAFKVGDKVRFARLKGGVNHWKDAPPLGWEGEITDIDESNLPIRVSGARWSESHISNGWWFTPACLDLVTPTA